MPKIIKFQIFESTQFLGSKKKNDEKNWNNNFLQTSL